MSTLISPGVSAAAMQIGNQNGYTSQSGDAKKNPLMHDNEKNQAAAHGQSLSHATMQAFNQKLASSNLKVEFAADQPVGNIWLNIVDNTTGKVIQKLPPDSVRKAAESLSLKGLQIDKQQ
jgi:uncharacterized FlaG/YvyC family protein